MARFDLLGGAGGNWRRQNEIDHEDVEAQVTADSCGPASARNVFRMLGWTAMPTHDDLYELAGRRACDVQSLARAMNELSTDHAGYAHWVGEALSPPADDYAALTLALAGYTPWIARLQEQRRMGHFVVVGNISQEQVAIRDPWPPGTAYSMSVADFVEHWSLHLVWRRGLHA